MPGMPKSQPLPQQPSAFDTAVNAARQVYNQVPPNARFLGEAVLGRTAPITEKDFTSTQLGAIRGQVERMRGINAQTTMQKQDELQNLTPEKFAAGQKEGLYRYNLGGAIDDNGNFHFPQFMPYGDYMQKVQKSYNSLMAHPEVTTVGGYKPQHTGMDNAGWGETLKKTFSDPDFQIATSLGRYKTFDTPQGMIVKDDYNFDRNNTEKDEHLSLGLLAKPVAFADTYMRKYKPGYHRDVNINLGSPDKHEDSWYRSVMGMPRR